MTDEHHDMRGPKERAFDERIKPLLAQIVELCKEHKINMAAQLALDGQFIDDKSGSILFCTTILTSADQEDLAGIERMIQLMAVMSPPPPNPAAIATRPETN